MGNEKNYLSELEKVVGDYLPKDEKRSTKDNKNVLKWKNMFDEINMELKRTKNAVESSLKRKKYPIFCFDSITKIRAIAFLGITVLLYALLMDKLYSWLTLSIVGELLLLLIGQMSIIVLVLIYLFMISKKKREFYKKEIETNLNESLVIIESVETLLNSIKAEKIQSEIKKEDVEELSNIKNEVYRVTRQAFKFVSMIYFYEIRIVPRDE